MKKINILRIVAILMLATITNTSLIAQYSGGAGTSGNPYQIATPADILAMQGEAAWKHYIFTADINMTGQAFTPLIDVGGAKFRGTINGAGHYISNLTITGSANNVGFLGMLQGNISNLGFKDVTVNGAGFNYVGAVVGQLQGHVSNAYTISNCWVLGGTINGADYVGSIVGGSPLQTGNLAEITNCFADADVNGTNWRTSGIAGRFTGKVENCVFYGDAISTIHASGIWGYPIVEQGTTYFPSTISGNYYDDDKFNGNKTNTGTVALTTAQVAVQGNFPDLDFATPIWKMASGTYNFPVLNIVPSSALPVELLSFNVAKQENNVAISWSTASEENNDFFTIEKSIDGKNFEIIGTVQGAGFSLEVLEYSFMDKTPVSGINYYRLKQTDFDGQFEYFDIKTLNFDANTKVSVYPNPTSDRLTINTVIQDEISIQIVNLNGQIVYQNSQYADNQLNIDLSEFANGIYFLKVTNAITQTLIYQDKLIKQ